MILGLAVVAPLPVGPASAQQPTVLEIETDGQSFRAPDTVRAGWTAIRLVNEDDAPHMAMLVRLDDGHTLPEFLDVYGEAVRTNGPRPPWGRRRGGPGATGPHGTTSVTQFLEPGHYAWVCIMGEPGGVLHAFSRREAHAFVVAPASGAAAREAGAAPEADVSIRLIDYAFELDLPIAPGRHVFRIHNEGSQPHEASLLRLPPGMSPEAFQEDLDAWLEDPGSAPAPEVAQAPTVASVASLEPGADAFFEAELTLGDYVLLCFVTAPDGRPHVMHGMVRYIRVD